MQKLISTILLLFSLFLLFLSLTSEFSKNLKKKPPFANTYSLSSSKKEYIRKSQKSTKETNVPNQMHAKASCLLDPNSLRVLYGQNENKKMPMASTTKIMTCIIALENGNLNSKVKVSSYAASMPDVQLNMQPNDTFYLKDLLYSLMLESHNDTAVAIAEHIGKSVKGFAKLMNNKAKELGCTNTHFVTPNGLDHKQHYTTAKELCLIASYAIQNKKFLSIIQTPKHQFKNCSKTRSYSVFNHDAFLTSYPGAIGIKTGFTGNAGYCFCGAAKKGNKTFISAVLACGWPPNKSYKWVDTQKLMNYGFSNYNPVTIPHLKLSPKIPIFNGQKAFFQAKIASCSKITCMLNGRDKIVTRFHFPKKITAPIRQGDIVGYEEYYLNHKLLYQFPIVSNDTVLKRTPKYYFKIIQSFFFFR